MQVYNHWSGLNTRYKKLVVGLGNFDGVHIGHQKLITEVTAFAENIGGTPAVITFHPHPLSVIRPENCPPLLLTQEYKHKLIAGLQVEVMLELPFDLEFARILPKDFIREILYEGCIIETSESVHKYKLFYIFALVLMSLQYMWFAEHTHEDTHPM